MIGILANQARGYWLLVLLFHLFLATTNGQNDTIQTTISTDAEHLIREVFLGGGDCFEVFNIELSGEIGQAGVFSSGNSTVGFEEGIILSNGHIDGIAAPNDAVDFSTTLSTGYGNTITEPDLEALSQLEGNVGLTISDVVVLEFDFIPTLDSISFDFVFASEEYCEFTLSTFIDLFGFFISGPGITGPFSNNGANIAVVPNTNDAITARSISPLFNSEYYINNIPPGELGCSFNQPAHAPDIFGFDGLTVPLTASTAVIPCETYHLKMIISDRGFDDKLDAAVFLKANSFAAGRTARLSGGVGSQSPNPIEGCSNTNIIFSRGDSVLTDDLVIRYDIIPSSTATQGVDYSGLPDSLILPAGVYSDTIDIDIIADNIPEGVEFFTLKLQNPCDCSQSELTVFIEEPTALTGTIDGPDLVCNGDGVALSVTPAGGFGDIDYLWSNGDTDSLFNDVPISDQTYQVIMTDACGQRDTIEQFVALSSPSATIEGAGTLCDGLPDLSFPVVLTGGSNFSFDLVENNITTTYTNITVDTVWIPTSETAIFEIENLSADGCPGTTSGSAAVFTVEINTEAEIDSLNCFADLDAIIDLTPNGGDGQYTFQWDHDSNLNGPEASNLGPGTYSVYINDNQGCLDTIVVDVVAPPLLEVAIDSLQLTANCLTGGILEGSASGGTAPYIFNWSNGETTNSVNNLSAGNYTLTIEDAQGCTSTFDTAILADSITPNIVLQALDSLDCLISEVTFDASLSDQGNEFTYQWTNSNNDPLSPADPFALTVDDQQPYTLSITNNNNGCSAEESIAAIDNSNTPVFSIESDDMLDCGITNVTLFIPDSLAGWQAEWRDMNGLVLATDSWTFSTDIADTYQVVVTDLNTGCSNTNDFVLNSMPEFPSLTLANMPDTLSCATEQVAIAVNTSDGSGNYSYEWDGPPGGIIGDPLQEDIDVVTSGNYTLIVTDLDGNCTDTLSVVVDSDLTTPLVQLTASPDTLNCLVNDIALNTDVSNGSGNYNYQWDGPPGGIMGSNQIEDINVTLAGNYMLIVTDVENGCNDTLETIIQEDILAPELSSINDTTLTCAIEMINVEAASNSNGSLMYEWFDDLDNSISTNNILTTFDAGIFSVVLTNSDNGCTDTLTVNIDSDTNLPVVALATPTDSLDCQTDMLTIDAAVTTGSGNYTYQWSGPSGGIVGNAQQEDVTINAAGSYNLIVNDEANGCADTLETVVILDDTAPVLNALPIDTMLTCIINDIEIEALSDSDGTLVYEWFDESGSSISQNSSVILTTTGNYSVSLTNTENGCSDESTVNILSNTDSPLIQLVALPDTLDCFTTEVVLNSDIISGSGDYAFQWTGPSGGINGDGTMEDIDAFEPGDYSLIVTDNINGCNDTLDVIVIEAIGTLSLDPLPDSTLNCSVNEITYTAQSPNVGNLEYEWFDNNNMSIQMGNMISLTEAGSYTVQVIDLDNSCAQSSIVNISLDTISPAISPEAFSNLDCETTDLSLSATTGPANFTPSWFNESGALLSTNAWSQNIQEAGNYTLEVLDTNNGCLSTVDYFVTTDTIAPVASITPPDLITCITDTVSLSSTVSAGSGDYTYEWSGPDMGIAGPDNQALTEAVLAGDYQLTITDTNNGCTAELTTLVNQDNTLPELTAINDTTLNCFAPSISLQATSLSTGTLSFSWEDENGVLLTSNSSILIEDAGQYVVQLINSDNGCEDQLTVIIDEDTTPPVANAGEDAFLGCDGEDITLTAVTGNDNWEPSWIDQNGTILSTGNWSHTSSEAGDYQLLVTNIENGCTATDFATIELDQSFPVANAGDDVIYDCFMNEALINATNSSQGDNFSYQLFSSDGTLLQQSMTSSFTVETPGTYQLIVIDENNNCESSDEVVVATDFPVITTISANNIPCTDEDGSSGSIILETVESGTPPYLYSIDGGDNFQINNVFNTLNGGTYDLVVQDANGCEVQDNATIIQESGVSVSLPETISTQWGESITLEPIISQDTSTLLSFGWDVSSQLECEKCLNNEFLANESEVLAFRVVDDMGCDDEALVRIIVDQRVPIYIPNAFSPDGDGFNDLFTIFGDADRVIDIAQFQVFDRWGNVVFAEKDFPINNPALGWDGTFRGKVLNSNVFVYQIEVRLQNGETTLLTGDILLVK